MNGGPFVHQHRVSYSSCTVGNHVYYSRYLEMLEEARGEFFRKLGFPLAQLEQQDVLFPIRECHIRFESSARYDELLSINLNIIHLDRLWLKFGFAVHNERGELIVDGQTDHVCTNADEKPKRMPKPLFETLGNRSVPKD